MRYYGASRGGIVETAMAPEQSGFFASFMAKLPTELQVVLNILLIVIVAAIAGRVIGKIYAAIKYPDPEKNHIISPKLRVLFACILAVCCVWLYATMTRKDVSELQPEEPGIEQSQPEMPGDIVGKPAYGDVAVSVGV